VLTWLGTNLMMGLVPATRTLSKEQFRKHAFSLTVLSLINVTSIVTQNAALVHIGLSVNQVIKCCVPLPTMVCAWLIQGKVNPSPIVAAVFLLVAGATLSVPFTDPTVTKHGLILTLISMFCGALRPVISAKLLAGAAQSGLSPIPLLWYDCAIATWVLLVVFCLSEEIKQLPGYCVEHPGVGSAIVCGGGTMAFAFNIVTFYLIKAIGPLGNVVLGLLKTTILVVVAATFVDTSTQLSEINILGYCIFFIALFLYSYLNYRMSQGTLHYPPLPCACCAPRVEEPAAVHPSTGAATKTTEKSKLIGR